MRALGTLAWALLLSVLAAQPAFADKRVALVIGNSAYRHVARLANPANDAAAMAATFKKANFDVVESRNDLPITEMRRVLRDFGAKARDADIAVIYYAGHGIELDGTNYLIPVDAQLETDTDVFDETLPLDRVLVAVEPARQLRLVILDACRDNPFSKTMKRTIGSRSVERGLAKVEPSTPNTMIAFAARAGSTASDGDGNSPFALALAQHLTTPGLDLRKAFGFVRDDVLKATNNKQEPFIYGSLGGNDVALVPAPAQAAPAAAAPDPNAPVRRDYELAAQVGTKEAWDSFLSAYPDGFYAKLALAQRNKLAAEEARIAATEKARLAAEQQARLAAEGAKAAEQAKAEAQAKAAEQARLAAEKKQAIEDLKLAEAERAKAAAQAKAEEDARIAAAKAKAEQDARAAREARAAEEKAAAEKAAEEKAAAEKAAADKAAEEMRIAAEKKKAADEARLAEIARARAAAQAKAEQEARDQAAMAKAAKERKAHEATEANKIGDEKPIGSVASLTPLNQPGQAAAANPTIAGADIPRLLQTELRRVGCNTGSVDGDWSAAAQQALALFNRHAGTTLDVKVASLDTLDVIKSKTARVCPLICDHGYKADGDNCVKIETKKPSAKLEGAPEAALPSAGKPPSANKEPATGGSGSCGATSCTAAMQGCMQKCSANGGRCTVCSAQYDRCMQTGTFIGRFCQHSGLARN